MTSIGLSVRLSILACSLAGCFPLAGPEASLPPPPQRIPLLGKTAEPEPLRRVELDPSRRVRLLRLTLPLGTFSAQDKLWQLLDEDAQESATLALLPINGLRMGVGPLSRWPKIAEKLDVPGAASESLVCSSDGRGAVQLATRNNIQDETLFFVPPEGRMEGRSFQRCDNLWRLWVRQDREQTFLEIEPAVQLETVTVVREHALGITRTSEPRLETFRGLRLNLTLGSDQFLVLAPSAPRKNPYSIGTQFLSQLEKSPITETILVFLPYREK